MSNNLAVAMIEARARQLWDEHQKRLPKFARQRWEDGSREERGPIGEAAFDQLMAEGLIRFSETGFAADGEEL